MIDVTSRMLRATCQMVRVVWTLPRHTSASDSPSACADGGGRGSLKRLAMPNLYLPPNHHAVRARRCGRVCARACACVRGFVDVREHEGPSAGSRPMRRWDEQSIAHCWPLTFRAFPPTITTCFAGRDAEPPHRRTAARWAHLAVVGLAVVHRLALAAARHERGIPLVEHHVDLHA